MLEIKDILKQSKYREYEAGRDLYGMKKINNLRVKEPEKGKIYHVFGVVSETQTRTFEVGMKIDEGLDELKILDSSCNCGNNGGSLCKHCVALAFSYIKHRKTDMLRNQMVETNSSRQTSSDLQDVIRKYAVAGDIIQNAGNALFELFLTSNESNNFYIHAKIGYSSMVNVQNLVKFAQDLSAKKDVQFSKKVRLMCDRAAFTNESVKKIDFIMELIKSKFNNFEDVIAVSSNYKTLEVPPFFMERLIDIYMDSDINYNGRNIHISSEPPKLCMIVKNENNFGISLSMDRIEIINGNRHEFILNDDIIYKCDENFSRDVMPFIRAMNTMNDKSKKVLYADKNFYFVNKNDYRAFCGNVIKKLEKYIGIVCEDINLDEYMPTEAKMRVYIEYVDSVVKINIKAAYGSDSYDVYSINEKDREYRDIAKERETLNIVNEYSRLYEDDTEKYFVIDNDDNLYDFLSDGLERLEDVARVYISSEKEHIGITNAPKINVGIGIKADLIDINIETDKINMSDMYEILNSYRNKKKYFRLKNGMFLNLESGNIPLLSDIVFGLNINKEQVNEGHISTNKYYSGYVDAIIREKAIDDTVKRNSDFKKLIRDIKCVEDTDFEVPKELNAKLRNYQKTGYRFLSVMSEFGFGGILADDMGLGKTLQVITLLESEKKTSLIICPSSLVYNWESEINKFAPDLSVLLVIGNRKNRVELINTVKENHVIITSYDLLKRDIEEYKNIQFEYSIIDEAQYIKNMGTQISKTVKMINAKHRFALTGTPIENRLSDIYSIFDYIMPGYLMRYEDFREKYEYPIVVESNEEVLAGFKKLVTPFILRRKKEDVLKDLPPKVENVVKVTMTDEQRKLYDARLNALKADIAGKSDNELKEDRMRVLAELTRLRQICCNPSICYDGYDGGSGKLEACMELIEEAIDGEHRILIFSQFVQMLEKIKEKLDEQNIYSLLLSGKNTKEERRNMVDEFQSAKVPVFLISLRAGGTGLNLTAADIVIHYDPWWNGAVQNQATDRAHRIGQIKMLSVMKLVARDSIEEKIMELQDKKKELADSVITGKSVEKGTIDMSDLHEILSMM